MATFFRHTMKGSFIEASSKALDEDEMYRCAGWWAFQGFELERVCLRTREDDSDLRLVIARDDGEVAGVLEMTRSGAKEWGWI